MKTSKVNIEILPISLGELDDFVSACHKCEGITFKKYDKGNAFIEHSDTRHLFYLGQYFMNRIAWKR